MFPVTLVLSLPSTVAAGGAGVNGDPYAAGVPRGVCSGESGDSGDSGTADGSGGTAGWIVLRVGRQCSSASAPAMYRAASNVKMYAWRNSTRISNSVMTNAMIQVM